jgi:hypothetical protein
LASGTTVTGGAMGTINDAVRNAGVFVNLDLSGYSASGNRIKGLGFYDDSGTLPSGSDFNIIWDNRYIKSIILPASLRTIGENAFCFCRENLESVTIPDGVTGIGNGAFAYCRVLKSAVIPDSVESIGYNAFFSNHSLESVTIGSGVRSIYDWAFDFCYNLKSVTFRGSGAVIESDDVFYPEGVGTYTLNGGEWKKR